MTLLDKKFEEVFKIVYPQTPQNLPDHHKILLKMFFIAGISNGIGLTSKMILANNPQGVTWLMNSVDLALKQSERDLNSTLT